MSTYLLLRDNKESGPYSFEELRSKGLKPYDLVWIDGRSAAWRYPSEVEELKSFAPAVEEQPFDRFYKKSAQDNAAITAQNNSTGGLPVALSIPAQARSLEKETSFSSDNGSMLPGEPSSIPGKRIIYVTLPAAKGNSGMRATPFREPAKVQDSIPVRETRTQANEKEPARTELPPRYINPAANPEEKFSQPSEDMWRGAVELTPRQHGVDMKRILQPIAAIGCILALLAAGIFIGLSIKSDSFGFSEKVATKETPATQLPVPVQHGHMLTAPAPVTDTASAPVIDPIPPATVGTKRETTSIVNTPPPDGPVSIMASTPAGSESALMSSAPAQKKKADKPRNRSSLVSQKVSVSSLPAKDSAAMGLPAVHREATHRTDETGLDRDAIRNSMANMVSVGSGKYTVGTFGGISDLQVTVSNHSLYPIDLVVVEVQYIQSNKKVFKTENMYFRDLGPGAAMMQEAPKSSRGIKVQYKITLINSKELGLSYSGA